MKKKNMIISFGVGVFLVLLVIAGISWKNLMEKENSEVYEEGHYINSEKEEEEEFDLEEDIKERLVKKDKHEIVWTISDDVLINEKYLKLFNDKLEENGYSFRLKFQYMDFEYYNDEIREVLKNGDTDIALGGQNTDSFQSVVTTFCRDGLFADLKPYLKSKEGKALWQEYEEPLWGSVTVDGTIYTIPNSIYDDGRYCVVFNNDYIDTKKSSNFDGDITKLSDYLTDEIKKDSRGKEFLWSWNSTDLASVLGYYQKYGMFFAAKTEEIKSPFACDELYNFMKMLHELQADGCIAEECSLYGDAANYEDIKEKIEDREFSILLTKETDTIKNMSDVTVVTLDFTPNFARTGGTNGICVKSEQIKEAVQLLTLLHTKDEYARLLLYGEEGTDYTLQNGYIEAESGTDVSVIDILGIYRSSCPDEEEAVYTGNIRKQKRSVYRSEHCITSVFSGFQIDSSAFTEEELLGTQDVQGYYDIWKESDFEEKFQAARKELQQNERKVYKKLNEQVQIWKQSKEDVK